MEALQTLGLWGDGDEIWAIEEAFAAVGLDVPVADAPHWITVGNLWDSVCRISPEKSEEAEHWNRFRQALSQETNVDWTKVARTTLLIDGRGHNIVSRLITNLREKLGKAA